MQDFESGAVGVCSRHQVPQDLRQFNEEGKHPAPISIGGLLVWTGPPDIQIEVPYYVRREIMDRIRRDLRKEACPTCAKLSLSPDESRLSFQLYHFMQDTLLVHVSNLADCSSCSSSQGESYYQYRLSFDEAIQASECPYCRRAVLPGDRYVAFYTQEGTLGRWHELCRYSDKALPKRLQGIEDYGEVSHSGDPS